ncbi:MAG: hypothetical protein ACTTIO_06970 [Candidatus Fimenecus sp.]
MVYSTKIFELIIYFSNDTVETIKDEILIKCIQETENRRVEYLLSQENENLYNVFSPKPSEFKPSKRIEKLDITMNINATTMKLNDIPHGNGNYEKGDYIY